MLLESQKMLQAASTAKAQNLAPPKSGATPAAPAAQKKLKTPTSASENPMVRAMKANQSKPSSEGRLTKPLEARETLGQQKLVQIMGTKQGAGGFQGSAGSKLMAAALASGAKMPTATSTKRGSGLMLALGNLKKTNDSAKSKQAALVDEGNKRPYVEEEGERILKPHDVRNWDPEVWPPNVRS